MTTGGSGSMAGAVVEVVLSTTGLTTAVLVVLIFCLLFLERAPFPSSVPKIHSRRSSPILKQPKIIEEHGCVKLGVCVEPASV